MHTAESNHADEIGLLAIIALRNDPLFGNLAPPFGGPMKLLIAGLLASLCFSTPRAAEAASVAETAHSLGYSASPYSYFPSAAGPYRSGFIVPRNPVDRRVPTPPALPTENHRGTRGR